MTRGAKITLVLFVIVFVLAGLAVGAWFLFKNDRVQAAESLIAQGDANLAEGNFGQALLNYKKAAILTPRSFAPYYKQGLLAQTTSHYAEAIDYFNRALKFASSEASVYLTLGQTYLQNNDLNNAKQAFLAAERISPQSDEINFYLLKTALSENNLDEAEKQILKAEKKNPLPKYKIYQALLASFNDPTESLEIISGISQCADMAGLSLADFSHLFQKMAEAKDENSRQIMLYQTFSQIGEVEFGISGLEKVTKENPQIRDAWVFLGYGYLMNNQPEKAKAALEKAEDLDPVFPATYYLLSKYYEATKDNVQAQETYDKAKELGFDENNPLKS